jgi:hypothetical protein
MWRRRLLNSWRTGSRVKKEINARYTLQSQAPVILVMQEAEIRRVTVQSQPGQIVCESLSRKYLTQKGLVEWLKV